MARIVRMFRTLAAGLIVTGFATSALAALPPQHQRAKELNAVIEAAVRVLEHRPIESVTRIENDLYRVETETCMLDVDIVAPVNAKPVLGPRQFTAQPRELECSGQ
jgi:7,8-dihydro-6-hydroxymethylpterin-pyrophosphokinase